LFDAPSDLVCVLFPHHPPGAEMSAFTVPCPNCGAVLRVDSRKSSAAADAEPPSAAGSAGDSFLATGKLLVENMTVIGELLGAITDEASAERIFPTLDQAIARHNELTKQLDAVEMSMGAHVHVAQARYQEYLAITSDISVSSAAAQMNAAAAKTRVPGMAKAIEAAMNKLGLT
jgi:hypothetical protein